MISEKPSNWEKMNLPKRYEAYRGLALGVMLRHPRQTGVEAFIIRPETYEVTLRTAFRLEASDYVLTYSIKPQLNASEKICLQTIDQNSNINGYTLKIYSQRASRIHPIVLNLIHEHPTDFQRAFLKIFGSMFQKPPMYYDAYRDNTFGLDKAMGLLSTAVDFVSTLPRSPNYKTLAQLGNPGLVALSSIINAK